MVPIGSPPSTNTGIAPAMTIKASLPSRPNTASDSVPMNVTQAVVADAVGHVVDGHRCPARQRRLAQCLGEGVADDDQRVFAAGQDQRPGRWRRSRRQAGVVDQRQADALIDLAVLLHGIADLDLAAGGGERRDRQIVVAGRAQDRQRLRAGDTFRISTPEKLTGPEARPA